MPGHLNVSTLCRVARQCQLGYSKFYGTPEKSGVYECGSRQTPTHPRTTAFRFCSLFRRQCAAHRPRERPRVHRLSSRVPARVVAHGHARPHAASTTERRRRRAVRSSGKHRTAATHVFHFTREEFARPSPVRIRYPRAHRRMRVRRTFLRVTLVLCRPVWKKNEKILAFSSRQCRPCSSTTLRWRSTIRAFLRFYGGTRAFQLPRFSTFSHDANRSLKYYLDFERPH
jgi:hypothetical protein